jgi:hypothetical protein
MRKSYVLALAGTLLTLSGGAARADDLHGSSRLLCAAVQVTVCLEGGECVADLPSNLNIPPFVRVDLDAKRIATTEASGENRATSMELLSRGDGFIVFHGFEGGRAFSWMIDESNGKATVAIAAGDAGLTVFGACTPIPAGGH